jgi:hypothetical protein
MMLLSGLTTVFPAKFDPFVILTLPPMIKSGRVADIGWTELPTP